MQTWGKFMMMNFNDEFTKEKVRFYLNTAYEAQEEHPYDKELKDDYGTVAIPDKFHFWFIIISGQMYVINARRGITQQVI